MKRRMLAAWLLAVLCVLTACGTQAIPPDESAPCALAPRPVICSAVGELAEQEGSAKQYQSPSQSVETYIYEALMAEKSEIDLEAYGIHKDSITQLYTDVMNTNPDLFFVESGISYTYTSEGSVVTLKPKYRLSGQELIPARQYCEQALDEICAEVDPNWSDFEIALYLHDYLCLHFEYDTNYEIYDMYQFLSTGKGVCQAYTLTYMQLLSRYGIASDVAVSADMNHIWNVITLGGRSYHVDVTWDDPVPNTPGQVLHSNFLRSDEGIAQTGHYGWVSDLTCSSVAYEDTFLLDVTKPFAYTAGTWTFADGDARAILQADFSTMSVSSVLEIEERWLTPDGGSYYVDAFVGVGAYRGNLIYNTPRKVIAYHLQSGVRLTLEADLPDGMQIFGLWVRGDTVYYSVSDAPDGQMQLYSGSLVGLAPYLRGDADQNGQVDGRDVTAIRRYLEGLPAVCHTGAADFDDNGTVDAHDVQALRQYLVESN